MRTDPARFSFLAALHDSEAHRGSLHSASYGGRANKLTDQLPGELPGTCAAERLAIRRVCGIGIEYDVHAKRQPPCPEWGCL